MPEVATRPAPAVRLVTDGACSGNPGPGGWACILSMGDHIKELSGGEAQTTNNRMELTALLEGLRALKRPCTVHVVSDSKYVIDAFEQDWLSGWQRKGWKKVKNPDLWQTILQAAHGHTLTFEWVQGHAGHPENERADQLAVQARDAAAKLPQEPRSGPVGGLF
ncbi:MULTISPECIES: ribonuclease HI [Deinococcus]|uniref:ribonuclease HI n=1 Tax=Deinococcus TaxID=1298 RepID=UPI0006DBE4A0|nr:MULTISPECIES: ribonuclease HI [Deinococcus]MCD0168705.1 ribonuclease HI [Deinococcus sp. 23YEL01]PIG95971.1 ribonuclease HI [Deinococcus sp. UR1]GHG39687.1 ribonuclease H [Deinococcus indicus]